MVLWFKCVEIKHTEKEEKENITMKWDCENEEGISIVMKFGSREEAEEFLGNYALTFGVGERFQIEIKAPKRLSEFGE